MVKMERVGPFHSCGPEWRWSKRKGHVAENIATRGAAGNAGDVSNGPLGHDPFATEFAAFGEFAFMFERMKSFAQPNTLDARSQL